MQEFEYQASHDTIMNILLFSTRDYITTEFRQFDLQMTPIRVWL